jgi:hypothetical protein
VIFNGHGGNDSVLFSVIQELKERLDSDIYLVKWWDLAIDEIKKTTEPPFFYACDKEISAYLLGQRVDHGKLKAEVRILKPKFVKHDFLAGGPKVYAATPPMTTLGGTGLGGRFIQSRKRERRKDSLLHWAIADRLDTMSLSTDRIYKLGRIMTPSCSSPIATYLLSK